MVSICLKASDSGFNNSGLNVPGNVAVPGKRSVAMDDDTVLSLPG